MEIESKFLLADRREHTRLVRALSPALRHLDQRNHYFDTDDLAWARHRVAVRLRWENGRPELTVKTAGEVRGDFLARGEFEIGLEVEEARTLHHEGAVLTARVFELLDRQAPGLAERLEALRNRPLREVGTMRTQRQVFALDPAEHPGLEVEVDETTYPDGSVRWEVELEVGEEDDGEGAITRLRSRLDDEGIEWRPSHTSKRERLQRILDA